MEGQLPLILTQAFPGEEHTLQECAVPAASFAAVAAPLPGPALHGWGAAYEHTINEPVRAAGGDRHARYQLCSGVEVDRRLVVVGGEDVERVGDGVR